jgi:elongation of very long chain fatty acids protein 6
LTLAFLSTLALVNATAQALYPFTWERAFDAGPTNVWMEDNGWFPVAACVLYAAFIVGGQRAMRSRPAFQLRGPLASWNLLLAIFSAVGTIRLVPHALTQLKLEGFHHLVRAATPPVAPPRKILSPTSQVQNLI